MRPYIRQVLFLTSSIFFLSACSVEDDENINPTSDSTFGIRHDRSLDEYEAVATNASPYTVGEYPDFSTVVNFTYSLDGSDNYEFVASGVLIDEDWILTAGHNFFVSDEQSSPAAVGGIAVNVGTDPNNPSTTREVSELVFHPTWLSDDGLFETANDLCLVKLSSPLSSVATATLYDGSDEPIDGTTWYCGYGDYSQLSGESPDDYSKRHAMENELDRKVSGITTQDGSTTYTGGLLAHDFDHPDGSINSLGDDNESQDESLLGSGSSEATPRELEGTTIEGDSGGPLFMKIDGSWQVVGILSGGATEPVPNHQDSDYGDISIYIRVSQSIDWINETIADEVLAKPL